jgi:uncharacterized membrane protein
VKSHHSRDTLASLARRRPLHREGARLPFVDVLRGAAVLFMVAFHTADGWFRPDLRSGGIWVVVRFLGGVAAPLFLLVVGMSLSLAMAQGVRNGATRLDCLRACVFRGLGLVVLGYLLRLQMWMLDGGGMFCAEAWAAAFPLLGGYLLAYLGLSEIRNKRLGRGTLALALAFPLLALGASTLAAIEPERLSSLLRVDILQAIGACMIVVSLVGSATSCFGRRPYMGLLFGMAVACATPAARSMVPGPLPEALAAYVARWDSVPGQMPAAFFPLFPWLGYVFVGSSLGEMWAVKHRARPFAPTALALCAAGALLALACFESLPPAYRLLEAAPVLTQPVRVAHRLGVVLMLAWLAYALCRDRTAGLLPLSLLGRASLPIYWIHLQFAFGAASRPLARQSSVSQWMLALCALLGLALFLAWFFFDAKKPPLWKSVFAFR